MATRVTMRPFEAEPPDSSAPDVGRVGVSPRRPVLRFATGEEGFWTLVAPQGLTGTLTLVVTYAMATATTGFTKWEARVEAISDGDTVDIDAAASFDATNATGDVAVPGTAGHIDQISITLTNKDSVAAADYMRIGLKRVAPGGTDATGTADVLTVELRDAA